APSPAACSATYSARGSFRPAKQRGDGVSRVHRRRRYRLAGLGHLPRLRRQRAPGLRRRLAGLRVRGGAPSPGSRPRRLGGGERRRSAGDARPRAAQPPHPRHPRGRRARGGGGTPRRRGAALPRRRSEPLARGPGARAQRAQRGGPHAAPL
ncbi:MAG: hypothetical protein AVDCRST_MAG89-2230, partial [uncultured Gemmatimonadetes bacterium]